MVDQNEPGVISILKAIRKLIETVPEEGQKVDWQDLKQKKDIALSALSAIEECFTHEPLNTEMRRCDNSWPSIWN